MGCHCSISNRINQLEEEINICEKTIKLCENEINHIEKYKKEELITDKKLCVTKHVLIYELNENKDKRKRLKKEINDLKKIYQN